MMREFFLELPITNKCRTCLQREQLNQHLFCFTCWNNLGQDKEAFLESTCNSPRFDVGHIYSDKLAEGIAYTVIDDNSSKIINAFEELDDANAFINFLEG